MRKQFFTSSSPGIILLIPLLTLALWFQSFFFDRWEPLSLDGYQMLLYRLVYSFFIEYLTWGRIVSILIVLLLAAYLIRINYRFIILRKQSYLPALLFVVFSGFILDLQRFTPILPAAIVYLYMIEVLFQNYEKRTLTDNIFKISFFIGIASFFYAPSLLFMIPLWIGMILLRPFFWREWVYSLLGVLLPFAFYLIIGFLSDTYFLKLHTLKDNLFYFSQDKIYTGFLNRAVLFYVLFLLWLIISYMMRTELKTKVKTRRFLQFLFLLSISSLLVLLLIPSVGKEFLIILFIPLSFLTANYYINSRRKFWIQVSIYYLILLIVMNQLSVFVF